MKYNSSCTFQWKKQIGDTFGTSDTYLIYRLTNQKSYTTDYTNASRTLFFNINSLQWSKELLKIFNLNLKKLPDVKESSSVFGYTDINGILKKTIAIAGVIGDSQSSIFANQCFNIGNSKITIGTGSSILTNIGNKFMEISDQSSKEETTKSPYDRLKGLKELLDLGAISQEEYASKRKSIIDQL